tara:strand:+ start:3113 stop:3313 length:201 start_codon:yes stop_codon:yes gene_type:complete
MKIEITTNKRYGFTLVKAKDNEELFKHCNFDSDVCSLHQWDSTVKTLLEHHGINDFKLVNIERADK